MAFKHVLKSVIDPVIPLKEMVMADDYVNRERLNSSMVQMVKTDGSSQLADEIKQGRDEPMVMIGNVVWPRGTVLEMIIDETEFIPKLKITIKDVFNGFDTVLYPKKNPIISVYVKSPSDVLKPIRNDYIITKMSPNGDDTWNIYGELFIPKLYSSVSRSYPNTTSKNTLIKLCKELGLGFQSNDFTTHDTMTWINPNWDNLSFMKYVIEHAYQDDESFFHSYIDRYYYLNMINVNLQLEHMGDPDMTYMAGIDIEANLDMKNIKKDHLTYNVLLKKPGYTFGSNVMLDYEIESNIGSELIDEGYRKRLYYYDNDIDSDPIDKMKSFYITPSLTSDIQSAGKLDILEPLDEDLKVTELSDWMGIMYDNVHHNYYTAKIINERNWSEMDKINVKAYMKGVNINIQRGQRILVLVYDTPQDALEKRFYENEKQYSMESVLNKKEILNEYVSDYYYVKGMKTIYDGNTGYSNEIILSKKEWITNE